MPARIETRRTAMQLHRIRSLLAPGLVLSGLLLAASGVRADPTQGLCNAVVAQALGTGLQVARSGASAEQCAEIGTALAAVIEEPCLGLVANGELLGIVSSASNAPDGSLSPLGSNICSALGACGFVPLLQSVLPGFCPGF
jgi:hypothetical protein